MIRPEYKLITDQAYINTFLTMFSKPEDVTNTNLQKAFSRNPKKDKDGKLIGATEPMYFTSDEFVLHKKEIANLDKDIETTFGLYVFNLLCLVGPFGDKVPYINHPMTDDTIGDLQQHLSNLLIEDKITGEQFVTFLDNFLFLGYKATIWAPGFSFEFVKTNPKLEARKKELIKEYKIAVAKGQNPVTAYVNMVETPLLKEAKEILKDDPDWPYYERGGKPKFGNVYKETALSMGPVFDPITGKFSIIEESLANGVPKEDMGKFANILVSSSYARAVGTQDGGAKSKMIFSSMQSVRLAERGSDCHTKHYIERVITEKNIKKNLYRFIIDDSKKQLIRLTYDNAKEYYGKKVKLRSALFCESNDYCNICAGDYYYEIGIKNIGTTMTRISSKLMQMSLKSMHSTTINTFQINPFKYIEKV